MENTIDLNQKIEPGATDKQQNVIGLRELCKACGRTWNEQFLRLNGNKDQTFYEIDEKRNQRTLERDDKIEYLLERIQEYKDKAEKYSAIARIVLNVPGKWEENFPDLRGVSVKEGNKFVLYCEIDQEENLKNTIDLLQKRVTDKISILLC
ncbi:MAG: hypothetical protein WA063_05010 [Minisyncoccia bacterium]